VYPNAACKGNNVSESFSSTAFETTLIALVAALIIQLLMTLLQQKEEEFLDECATYCHKNLTSHLKMIDIQEEIKENQEYNQQ
jgi:hypothetical protein